MQKCGTEGVCAPGGVDNWGLHVCHINRDGAGGGVALARRPRHPLPVIVDHRGGMDLREYTYSMTPRKSTQSRRGDECKSVRLRLRECTPVVRRVHDRRHPDGEGSLVGNLSAVEGRGHLAHARACREYPYSTPPYKSTTQGGRVYKCEAREDAHLWRGRTGTCRGQRQGS